MAEKKVIDWEKIELDYRAGIKSLREIADEHGISHVSINKRAKRDDWVRDLSAKIKAKSDNMVTKSLVTSLVTSEKRISEKEIIDANAQAITNVVLDQRTDVQRAMRVTNALFEELENQVGIENALQLEELGELLRSEDDKGRDALNDIYHKIISLPGRVKAAKDLGDNLKTLVMLQRHILKIDEQTSSSDALADLLNRIAQSNNSALSPIAQDKDYA
ncbi:MAG: hypothetical protein RSC68_13095 [Acinetobacter sp.]